MNKKMCGIACGVSTAVLGAALLLTSTIVGYGFIGGFIENIISNELALYDDTLQLERFADIPFPLFLNIRAFNITNPDDVLSGAIPVVNEVGPYVYKLYVIRNISDFGEETLDYSRLERFEFDAEASYPHTEDDILTVANVAYNAVLQVAEVEFPELIGVLGLALNGVFGELNSPLMSVRAGALFFEGLPLCTSPGLLGSVACSQIRNIAGSNRNMEVQPDGSLLFSALGYRNGKPSSSYKVYRGVDDARDLGRIITYDNSYRLRVWPEGDEGSVEEHSPNICNTIRGTDSGVFPPFLTKDTSIYAFNTDICRAVELRHQYELEYRGVTVMRYTANEWFLDNNEGCFCLNLTKGVTGSDGCLLSGAQELYSCVGGFLVLSYPHFLYADPAYLNGVIGMAPDEDKHKIFMDLEPNTGIAIRGAAKAQINIFLRPISQITGTRNLPNVLTPLFWIEEGLDMPEEYLDELKEKLLAPLGLVDILVPVLVAFSSVVLVLGVGVATRAWLNQSASKNNK